MVCSIEELVEYDGLLVVRIRTVLFEVFLKIVRGCEGVTYHEIVELIRLFLDAGAVFVLAAMICWRVWCL